jgi:uncharacterized integral membrane protein (TIGR00698 family)
MSVRSAPIDPPSTSGIFRAVGARAWGRAGAVAPGVAACVGVGLVATALAAGETSAFGRAWLEPLVLCIIVAAVLRNLLGLAPRLRAGVNFCAKTLLEWAVVLIGASISGQAIMNAGPGLVAGVALIVVVAIGCAFALGRAFGLPWRMSLLVACGNAICGNSAIAAVAPVISADAEDVASAIAFTAVLGVGVILALPLCMPLLHFSRSQFGVLAGLTVYAVPQVLATTTPFGAAAVQIGTIVKLLRVLMLGPVVLVVAMVARRTGPRDPAAQNAGASRFGVAFVPWFIIGFLVLMALHTLGVLGGSLLKSAAVSANLLTLLAMAALGFGVDFGAVRRAGMRTTCVVVLSLATLTVAGIFLIKGLGVG